MKVSGIGPEPSDWMVIGEGPGPDEDRKGAPFVGKTGDEMRRFFDGADLPPFAETFRTNIYRYYMGKDYEYTQEDLDRDEPELLDELRRVQPAIIVAVGRYATRWLLGDVTMDEVHGLPWFLPADAKAAQQGGTHSASDRQCTRRTRSNPERDHIRTVVFPCYHPAAGFRSPEASALVSYDFAQLALYAAGDLVPRALHDDPYPSPQYIHVTSADTIRKSFALIPTTKLAVDSEGSARIPWSVQWSRAAGTGYLARATDIEVINAFLEWLVEQNIPLIYHSALHDRAVMRALARLCGWSEERILFEIDQLPFDDTMIMAYLLQLEPQGLKGLCTRHANMAMQSYDEILGDAQTKKAIKFLTKMWDLCNKEYEEEQREEFEVINSTPLRDKQGKIKRRKDGTIQYRRTTVLPKIPKSPLFKAVERCLRAREPYTLYLDQNEDIQVDGYNRLGEIPEASLSDVPVASALRYGCRDADGTVRVEPHLRSRIEGLGLEGVYELERRSTPLIDRMAVVGMRPNLKIFSALSHKLSLELAKIQVRIEQATGREGFNANSGDQVAAYLFDDLGLEPLKMTSGGKKESRGSTNDKILEALEKEEGHAYPVISDFREYREVYKLKHTFVDRVPDYVNRYPFDGRVHATFRTTRVVSGRLAASDPNVLAQPEHGKFAKDFKAGWEAEDGHLVCNWDLSQVELRVLAHLSRDPVLNEAYSFECRHRSDWQSGKTFCKRDECILRGDLHARLAHQMFGVGPSKQDDSQHRLPSKAVNFGIPMGMTCHGLMIELRKNGVSVDEEGAQEWLDASNKLYKLVPKYKDEKIAEARRLGYVRCLSGRIRYIGGIRSRDERLRSEAERFAFSTPIQEGAQRSVKEAEAYIWEELLVKKYYKDGWYKGGSRGRWVEPLCQVHDALKMEVAEGLERELHAEMSYAMTKVPTQLRVPLGVEGKFGRNFKEMEKFR